MHTCSTVTYFRCLANAHDTLAGNSRWNPAPETRAGFQREFPAPVATKFALVSSASFQLWHPYTALKL